MVKKTLIQAIDRAVEVMNIVTESVSAVRVADIAEKMGLDPRTVHNIVRSLFLHGYLLQDENNHYLPGPECLRLGNAVKSKFEALGYAAREPVGTLARQTGNTSFMGCEYYGTLYCVALFHESGRWEINGRQEWLNTIHATAAGKIIIADKGLDWFDRLAKKETLERFTPETVTTVEAMAVEINKIERDGFALCINEHLPGVAALGLAVRGTDGVLLGALTQSFPDYFLETGRIVPDERIKIMRECASRIVSNHEELKDR